MTAQAAGALCYAAEDVQRNAFFIGQVCHFAELEGLSLRLCLANEVIPADVQFAVNRSRSVAVSQECETVRGIPVYNSLAVTEITNDKYRTYCHFCLQHGIPMAETAEVRTGDSVPDWAFPLVAKPPCGHGGAGVTWIPDSDSLEQMLATMPRPFLLQKAALRGWDTRVYVLGGRILAAAERTSETDFRSNFSLGGNVRILQPDAEMCALVSRIQKILPFAFAGVDFLRAESGEYLLGEIEDAVGCRMLYQYTDINPAQEFARYLREDLRVRGIITR